MSHIIDPSGGDDVNFSDVVEAHTHDGERTVPGLSTGELSTKLAHVVQAPLLTQRSPLSRQSTAALVDHCRHEINRSYQGGYQDDAYCVELFRRATLHNDQDAWHALQQCLRQTVLKWLDTHPAREAACRLNTEEHYLKQTFKRFTQATVHQQVAFSTLADALLSLCMHLNSAVVDSLRASLRLQAILVPRRHETAESGATSSKQSDDWEMLRSLLPDVREQRLAFLLFHCGLRPKQIVQTYSQEFPDVEEISRLRCRLIQQVLDRVDRLD